MAADPRIARVQPASPTSVFLMGVAPGRTTVVATAEDGSPVAQYDVSVLPSTSVLASENGGGRAAPSASAIAVESAIRRSLPGMESVRVRAAGPHTLILRGMVSNAVAAQQAEAVARSFAGDQEEVINDLQLLSSIQVNVRVRVAEVSRQITRELGFNWQAFGKIGSFLLGLRTGTGTDVARAITTPNAAGASVIGLGAVTKSMDINSVIDTLAEDQLITILAEPNLTAQSGETASFLAGGEFPVPTGTSGSSDTITVQFKQFGVSLAFVPTVLSPDRLNLRIRPEVSALSQNGAVSLPLAGGTVTIPALTVRRAETTVELGSGQSFAIAGLLQRNTSQDNSGPLGIGEIPVFGTLFRTDNLQRSDSELVIIVTPYLVRPVSNPRQLAAPTDGFQPATDLDRILYQRQIARGSPMPQLHQRPDAGFILE
jgi:pilus assembly protein CpaC